MNMQYKLLYEFSNPLNNLNAEAFMMTEKKSLPFQGCTMTTFSAITMHYSRYRIVYPEVGCKTSRGLIMLQTWELIFLIDICHWYVFLLHLLVFRSWISSGALLSKVSGISSCHHPGTANQEVLWSASSCTWHTNDSFAILKVCIIYFPFMQQKLCFHVAINYDRNYYSFSFILKITF
jgi:hypothetical protein